jgi:hypothetical protein
MTEIIVIKKVYLPKVDAPSQLALADKKLKTLDLKIF